jgi:hypothetical protein
MVSKIARPSTVLRFCSYSCFGCGWLVLTASFTAAIADDDLTASPPRFSRSEVEALSLARTGSAKVPSNGASQKAMLTTNAANDDDVFTASPPRFSRSEVEALSPARTGSTNVPSNGTSQKAMLATNASIAATLADGSPGSWCGEFRRDAAVCKKNAC